MELPIFVTKLGKYTFFNSSVETIKLSQICTYSEYTFPENVELQYYDISNVTVLSYPNKSVFYLYEQVDLTGLSMQATITDGENSVSYPVNDPVVNTDSFDSSTSGNYIVSFEYDSYSFDFDVSVMPYIGVDAVQEENDDYKTSATLSLTTKTTGLLMMTAMHRESVSINGDGWQRIDSVSVSDGDITQSIAVWYKVVEAGTYSVTVTQSSSVRLSCKLFCFYGCSTVTVAADTPLVSNQVYEPPQKTGKKRLYLGTSAYSDNDGIPSITFSNYTGLDPNIYSELRYSAMYDHLQYTNIVPSIRFYRNYEGCSLVLTLDLE